MISGTALVIGASKGIGLAIAERLAHDGYDIAGTGRNETVLSSVTKPAVEAAGRRFTPLCFDVTDPDAIEKEYSCCFQDSAPAVIVYNAGTCADNVFALMSRREWSQVIHTNLDGFYNSVQPLLGNMIAQKHGRIIVISSLSGQAGQAGQVNYGASKAALIGAVKSLAKEVARRNILVNAVAPGVIDTEMTKELPADKILPLIPLKRYGRCSEVAAAVSFLAGPDSSYITGQVISVNGGMYI